MATVAVDTSNASGASFSPFEGALQEAHGRLLAAHSAAVATLEAELQHMRMENMRLRLRLAEAGLAPDSAAGQASKTSVPSPQLSRTQDQPLSSDSPRAQEGQPTLPSMSTPVPDYQGSVVPAADPGPSEVLPTGREPELVEEVQSSPTIADPGAVVLALGSLLRRYELQGLPVSQHGKAQGEWNLAGRTLLLRQKGCDLEASGDGGQNWELLESLFVQHLPQLQALKRDVDAARVSAIQADSAQHPQARPLRSSQSSQDYGRQVARLVEPVTGPSTRAEVLSGGLAVERADGLPAWRPDGLPTFHNAFPQNFDALSGADQYYSQFRVRVPTASQYDMSERNS